MKAATIRGISLGAFEDAARGSVDEYVAMLSGVEHLLGWCMKHGYGIGLLRLPDYDFRIDRDQAAAIRRVLAAWLYSYEVRSVDHLAELMDLTVGAAANLLTQARRAGYLTPGTPGKAGGQMTPEGSALLEASIGALKKYEEGMA